MKDAFLFTEVEGGGLLEASKGSWAEFIMKSGLRSTGKRERGVVKVQEEGINVCEQKQKGVKLQQPEELVYGCLWYIDEELDRVLFDIVGDFDLEEV